MARSGKGKATKAPAKTSLASAIADQAELASELLRAMAHPQRLRVLCMLVDGERSVGEINQGVDLSQSALSQHLARLRADGLVTTRKEAQTVFYRLASGPALAIIQTLHQTYCGNQKPCA